MKKKNIVLRMINIILKELEVHFYLKQKKIAYL